MLILLRIMPDIDWQHVMIARIPTTAYTWPVCM